MFVPIVQDELVSWWVGMFSFVQNRRRRVWSLFFVHNVELFLNFCVTYSRKVCRGLNCYSSLKVLPWNCSLLIFESGIQWYYNGYYQLRYMKNTTFCVSRVVREDFLYSVTSVNYSFNCLLSVSLLPSNKLSFYSQKNDTIGKETVLFSSEREA